MRILVAIRPLVWEFRIGVVVSLRRISVLRPFVRLFVLCGSRGSVTLGRGGPPPFSFVMPTIALPPRLYGKEVGLKRAIASVLT